MARKILFYLSILVLASSCNLLRPSLMLRTKKDFVYDSIPRNPDFAYKIAENDVLEFKMYSNNGFKLVDIVQEGQGAVNNNTFRRGFEYQVEYDGTAKLPVVGRISLKGLTIREAEIMLEEKYASEYKDPFVILRVTNRRVIVFPGSDGNARIVNLDNDNVTLMEALALSGGIYQNGKAYKIKLIRGDHRNPKVYKIDFSTLDGFKTANPILQANDIIYVEAKPQYASRILANIAPYITLTTSLILFYTLLRQQSN